MSQNTRRPHGFDASSFLTGLAIGGLVMALSVVAIVPTDGPTRTAAPSDLGYLGPGLEAGTVVDDGSGAGAESTGSATARAGVVGSAQQQGGGTGRAQVTGSGGAQGQSGTAAAGSAECNAGRNGGATDTGVTADSIKLGATVVLGGFASAFLGQVPQALEAVEKKVNAGGGVCGRRLQVVTVDDEWNPQRGKRNIENLISDGVFAFAVSPSSEGLNEASKAEVFKEAGVPVVGADGLNNTQFLDSMIWPVAAATTTTVHSIMKNAFDRCKASKDCGELRPAIVFGNQYRFGVEGAFAFNAAYHELTGKNIPGYSAGATGCQQGSRYCGVPAGQDSYGGQVNVVNSACGVGTNDADRCNFLLLLLEPDTALKWMKGTPGSPLPRQFESTDDPATADQPCCGIGGAQPLFTASFAEQCGEECHEMWVWTGYNPPIEQYAPERNAATRDYVTDLHAQSANADQYNQFTEGGYVGMLLLVEALRQTGPQLTRARLIEKLNSMDPLVTGLSVPLKWTADSRYANHSAQAFLIPAANGWTGGWEFAQEYVRDPWLGQHNQLS